MASEKTSGLRAAAGGFFRGPHPDRICIAVILLWAVLLSGAIRLPRAAQIAATAAAAAAFAVLLCRKAGKIRSERKR